jgi:hypothetical protein
VRVRYIRTPQGEFQHTLSECLVWAPLVILRLIFLCVSTTGIHSGDAPQGGAYFGNWQDFPVRGAIQHYMHLGQLYHIPKNPHFHGL